MNSQQLIGIGIMLSGIFNIGYGLYVLLDCIFFLIEYQGG